MNIIEKLRISPAPWVTDEEGGYIFAKRIGGASMTEQNMMVCQMRGWGALKYHGEEKAIAEQKANQRLIWKAPEMLEALILIIQDKEDFYQNNFSTVKCKKCFEIECGWLLEIIESATGKTWQEIKGLIND